MQFTAVLVKTWDDMICMITYLEARYQVVVAAGVPADFKSYRGMGHAYCPEAGWERIRDDIKPPGTCSKGPQQHPPATKEALDVTSFIRQQLKRSIDPKDLAAMSAKDWNTHGCSTVGWWRGMFLIVFIGNRGKKKVWAPGERLLYEFCNVLLSCSLFSGSSVWNGFPEKDLFFESKAESPAIRH